MSALLRHVHAPRDAAGLAVFRILVGLLGVVSSVRFMAEGWVEQAFVMPSTFFKFWGLSWIEVLPPTAMYAAFVLMAISALFVALGLFYRVAIVTFFLVFTYVELIDVTNYLNHYYLVSLLTFLMCWMPLGHVHGLDGWRSPAKRRITLPAWMLWMLRAQVAIVYMCAAAAKTGPDWLVHGQPLGIWLAARTETPLIGPYLDLPAVALAMSWAGFLFDATIVPLMLWSRTRPVAFAVALMFHTMVGALFNIGMFPWIMVVTLTLFFPPGWPRRWLAPIETPSLPEMTMAPTTRHRLGVAAMALYLVVQVALPTRALAYGGDVLWHEQGMRFAWKVMVREKNGSVTYRVKSDRWQRERHVHPSRYLTRHQEREMSGQPDQILQLAHVIARDLREEGHASVEIRVDALASLNGRSMQPLIDPDVDLARIEDGLGPARWITPAPTGPPLKMRPLRHLPKLCDAQ